jgi:O-antigen/teichoic acid export membrane protein
MTVHATAPSGAEHRIRSRILRGSAVVFLGRLASMALGVGVNALLARMLARGEMGAYFAATSMVLIGSTIAGLGLNKAIVRLVAGSLATGRTGRARDAIHITFGIGIVSSLLLATVLAMGPGKNLAVNMFGSEQLAEAMPFVAGWLAAYTLMTLVAETFRGFKRFKHATVFASLLVDVFSFAVFGMMWLSHAHPTLSDVLLVTLALTGGSALIGGLLIARRLRKLRGRGAIDPTDVLAISLPLMVVTLSSFFVGTGVDLWVVGRYEGLREVALYGAAARLMFLVQMPFFVVSQVVPPIVAQLHAQGRRDELERTLRSTATLAAGPAAIVLLSLMVISGWLLQLVYGAPFYRGAATVLAVLGIARLIDVSTGLCGVALSMTGHQRPLMYVTMVSAVVSLSLELILVQPYGIVGVAVATCLAQALQNGVQLVMARRRLGIWTQAEFSLRPFLELAGRRTGGA